MIHLSVERREEDGMVLLRIGKPELDCLELELEPATAMGLAQLLTAAARRYRVVDVTEPNHDGDPYASTMRRELSRREYIQAADEVFDKAGT